jgi:hypothetical protein
MIGRQRMWKLVSNITWMLGVAARTEVHKSRV